MHLDGERMRHYLASGRFDDLFIEELGWDALQGADEPYQVDEATHTFTLVAQKRGVAVLACEGPLPDHDTRRKLERLVNRRYAEHLIVYHDPDAGEQVWQWMRREPGKPLASREVRYSDAKTGEALRQRLESLAVSLDEEGDLTLLGVSGMLQAAFDVDKVTKKFYERFRRERNGFQKLLEGIPDGDLKSWYVSVMLNRLMFLYFVLKKGLLDGDHDYMRCKLQASQQKGSDRYYQEFLCPLFFAGLAQPVAERDAATQALLGKVPYLNGGIFQRHQVEKAHGETIRVPDAAFEKLFDYFEAYQWHLDDRPLRADNEINPDVLGYIFEKYVNQRQMGAYYTKEDITEYICKNTILPFLLQRTREGCKVAFDGKGNVWGLLQENPDRYIYAAVRHGCDLALPEDIARGLDDVGQRESWNTVAPEEYALPTELWRETVARRQRYEAVREKLVNGEVREANDLITLNLDIRQFLQDAAGYYGGSEFIKALWGALTTVTVLDPTCGSGAFLFAALNILEPLYETCLERMEAFVAQADADGHGKRYQGMRQTLAEVERHPNRAYFVLKRIMLNNLYGVDIMEEAIEICRLRLFLKLMAQIEKREQIEPLPDIDFNIRAGNTLVGFLSFEQVQEALTRDAQGETAEGAVQQNRMLGLLPEVEADLQQIQEEAVAVQHAFCRFRQQQTQLGVSAEAYRESKRALSEQLGRLDERLDRALAREYGVAPQEPTAYGEWKRSHQPFHWWTHFYGIMGRGGFDVIVGNPPYVNAGKTRKQYQVLGLRTESCPDIYAWFLETCPALLSNRARAGMIIPLSLAFSRSFRPCRMVLEECYATNWFSSYGRIPSALFPPDVRVRNVIHLGSKQGETRAAYTTRLHRWFERARPVLFSCLQYTSYDASVWQHTIPRVSSSRLVRSLESLLAGEKSIDVALSSSAAGYELGFKKTAYNWLNLCVIPPPCYAGVTKVPQTQYGCIKFISRETRDMAELLGNGKLMLVYWFIIGDDFHVTKASITSFPADLGAIWAAQPKRLLTLLSQLREAMASCLQFKTNAGVRIGSYNLAHCRDVTDISDLLIAEALGIRDVWDEVELAYSQSVRTQYDWEG